MISIVNTEEESERKRDEKILFILVIRRFLVIGSSSRTEPDFKG